MYIVIVILHTVGKMAVWSCYKYIDHLYMWYACKHEVYYYSKSSVSTISCYSYVIALENCFDVKFSKLKTVGLLDSYHPCRNCEVWSWFPVLCMNFGRLPRAGLFLSSIVSISGWNPNLFIRKEVPKQNFCWRLTVKCKYGRIWLQYWTGFFRVYIKLNALLARFLNKV